MFRTYDTEYKLSFPFVNLTLKNNDRIWIWVVGAILLSIAIFFALAAVAMELWNFVARRQELSLIGYWVSCATLVLLTIAGQFFNLMSKSD